MIHSKLFLAFGLILFPNFSFFAKDLKNRTLSVKNAITPQMLKYYFYSPDQFSLTVEDKPLQFDEIQEIEIKNHRLKVHYECTLRGIYKSEKELYYTVDPHYNHAQITFSWDKKERIIVSNAQLDHFIDLQKKLK
jgi:hypothetical protein